MTMVIALALVVLTEHVASLSAIAFKHVGTGCTPSPSTISFGVATVCRKPKRANMSLVQFGVVKNQVYKSYQQFCESSGKINYFTDDACMDFLLDTAEGDNCDDYMTYYSYTFCCSASGSSCDVTDGPTLEPTMLPTVSVAPTTSPTESPSAAYFASAQWGLAGIFIALSIFYL